MRSVITVVGKDVVGILAAVSGLCAEHSVNVIEVSQSILQDMFCMIMLTDVSRCDIPFTQFTEEMERLGDQHDPQLKIHVMHEDIFNSMHNI